MITTYTYNPNGDPNHRPRRLYGVVESVCVVVVCMRVCVYARGGEEEG